MTAFSFFLAKKAEADGLKALKEAGVDEKVLELKRFESLVKLADGVMFEGGTWKGVVLDLSNCRHFIFRRAWLDGCEVRADGASECVIEYLDSPAPVPRQVFEIVNRKENESKW